MLGVQGQEPGGERGSWNHGDPEGDDWGDQEWDAMVRAAAAAHDAAFWEVPPEPVVHIGAPVAAQHLRREPTLREAFREDPWPTVKGIVTAKGTLLAVGAAAAAVAFVMVAVAAFTSGSSSDDVTLNGDAGGTDTRGLDGDTARDETGDGTTSTVADTTTAPSSSTTDATTTTTEDAGDEDEGEGDPDDDGGGGGGGGGADDPPVAPLPTNPGTEPPPPSTTAPTTTTTAAPPVAQPAIDSFDVALDRWCNYSAGTVEATFRWSSRNGSSATLSSNSPGQAPYTVNLSEDDFDVCPRPGDRWTLRVTGPAGTTPATRTITVPSLPR